MKTNYYFILLFLCCSLLTHAEEYIILTSTQQGTTRYIYRGATKSVELYETSPKITFILRSKGEFTYAFMHCDYNVEEAQRQLPYYRPDPEYDNHEIIMKPKSFLNEIEPVDLDVLFPTWTEADVETFCDSLHRKKVYIIDRNDITNDSIKLIEVRYFKMLKF